MSDNIVERIKIYLYKQQIDMEDYILTQEMLCLDERGNIISWGFPVKKPSKKDLYEDETFEQKEKREKDIKLKYKIKQLRQFQVTCLSPKEVDEMKKNNLFEIGDIFISSGKLYVITSDPLMENSLDFFSNNINYLNK